MKKILVTGAAGFIGFHTSKKLLEAGFHVFGIDNLTDYYDVSLKQDRMSILKKNKHFGFSEFDLIEESEIHRVFEFFRPEIIVHLAAQAGVRYSMKNPKVYLDSNINGFVNLLEACRRYPVEHFIFASSSSVYGANRSMPFKVGDTVDYPISLYAATKRANELLAFTYAHNFQIPLTGLRFFTVYGPWGRPDMSPFIFARAILDEEPITLYNQGKLSRDFTYIDDIVEGIYRLLDFIPTKGKQGIGLQTEQINVEAPLNIFNIGYSAPIKILDFVQLLEKHLEKKAHIQFGPAQPGDMEATYADVSGLQRAIKYSPKVAPDQGVQQFAQWFKAYYK